VKFGEPYGAVLEVAQNGAPVGRLQRDGIEASGDAGLDDVGRCDSIGVRISMKAGDDPPGVVRSHTCPVHVEHAASISYGCDDRRTS